MKKIKHLIISYIDLLWPVAALSALGLFLLMLRLKLTSSYFYLFLVWNLFLAWIPLWVALYLSRKKPGRLGLLVGSLFWLLFLPNAPYILTDFIHLGHPKSRVLLDGVMLAIFAITGLICYLISLRKMERLWRVYFSRAKVGWALFLLPFVTGFGVYLGRFLRWNSWDVVQQPQGLFYDIVAIITSPQQHRLAWGTTLVFGLGLWLLHYWSAKKQVAKG